LRPNATPDLGGLIEVLDDLSVVYQSIVHLNDETLFAHEALARCVTPGLESPTALLRRASELGMTGVLGRVLREKACATSRDLPLFVNVHPHELTEPWLHSPDDPIFSHRQPVYLEVTETMPLGSIEEAKQAVEALRAHAHIHFVVDDLGAGFSNLRRISDLAPSVVKVDKNLITGLPENRRQQLLLKAIVRLCEDLGARVVAEGIEHHDEFHAARDAGAHYGQGFLWARPGFPDAPAKRPHTS
jgi:EAL domain-containing protein (putative c-di-GMP-specific phosphodiesterase class I)